MRLQLLTNFSWQAWLLYALDHCERCSDSNRDWTDIDIHSVHVNWYLDRLSDPRGRWSGMWDADGECRDAVSAGINTYSAKMHVFSL